MKTITCVALFALSISAHAQKVFKCTDANGIVVFSQQECGKDAKQVMDIPKSSQPQATTSDKALRDISNSADDSGCRINANHLARQPSTSSIDQANSEIASLERNVWVDGRGSTSSYYAQSLKQQDEQRIATLRQVISSEEARNDVARAESDRRVAEALAVCDKKQAEREGNTGNK